MHCLTFFKFFERVIMEIILQDIKLSKSRKSALYDVF